MSYKTIKRRRVGILNIHNGCCPGTPVMVYSSRSENSVITYAAECRCGIRCATSAASVSGAVREWEKMQ